MHNAAYDAKAYGRFTSNERTVLSFGEGTTQRKRRSLSVRPLEGKLTLLKIAHESIFPTVFFFFFLHIDGTRVSTP